VVIELFRENDDILPGWIKFANVAATNFNAGSLRT
jgi:hypothetical protein